MQSNKIDRMHPISPFKNTHFYYFMNDYEIRKCIFISTITQHENIIQVPTNDKQITYILSFLQVQICIQMTFHVA